MFEKIKIGIQIGAGNTGSNHVLNKKGQLTLVIATKISQKKLYIFNLKYGIQQKCFFYSLLAQNMCSWISYGKTNPRKVIFARHKPT